MNFDSAKLKEFLTIMRDHGIESGELDGFKFVFGSTGRIPLDTTPETPEARYEQLKQALLEANKEQDEIESWSAS